MAVRFFPPVPQFIADAGGPAVGWTLYFYEPGTSTPKAVYSDEALTTPAGTSVTLDASGSPETDIYLDGLYKVVMEDADGVTKWTRDDFGGFVDNEDLQATYATKITSPTSGNLVSMDANGDIQDAGGALDFTKDTSLAATAVSGTTLTGAMLAAGALVEWGSNANGEYWRWESGLQVCAVDFLLGASVADGATVSATWTYPAAFASVPEVRVSAYSNSTNTARVIGGNDTNRTATSADVYGGNFRSALGATAVAIDIRASGFAIGSWK